MLPEQTVISVLKPGNIWSRHRMISVELAFGPMDNPVLPPSAWAEFVATTPFLRAEVRDFPAWRRLSESQTPMPFSHYVEAIAICLQRSLYWPVRETAGDQGDLERAIFETRNTSVGRRAAATAVEIATMLSRRAINSANWLAELFRKFQRAAARFTPAFDTLAVAERADRRGIDWASIPRSIFVQLGSGQFAKMLYCSESSDAPLMAKRVAKSKPVTSAMLEKARLPVARHKTARSVRTAIKAAREIGGPVVLKPAKGRQGKGVTVGVTSALAIGRAFKRARKFSKQVQVEALIPGEEYRLLVLGGQFVAASQRRPARVVGNGRDSVGALIEAENARPERAPMPSSRLSVRHPIEIDDMASACLAHQGLSLDSVPDQGQVVYLRSVSNVSQGGDTIDVTARVHPSIREAAETAARILKLDACGVDFITPDISRPYGEVNGAICELNTQPGLSLHLEVSEGRPQDVATAYLELLYPEGAPHRVPTVVLVDQPSDAALRRRIEKAFKASGRRLGVYRGRSPQPANGEPVPPVRSSGSVTRFQSLADLLASEETEAALILLKSKRIANRGAGVTGADLVVFPDGTDDADTALARTALERVADAVAVDSAETTERCLAALGLRQAVPVPAPKPRPDFRAILVGDLGFGESYAEHPRAARLKRLLAERGHSASIERVAPLLADADLVLGNLEVPLSWTVDTRLEDRKNYLGWSDPEKTLTALTEAGFNAFNLANNHALDCGRAGLRQSVARLQNDRLTILGGGETEAAAGAPIIKTFEIGGVSHSLVIFSGFEYRKSYATRYGWYADAESSGVARLSSSRIAAQIEKLRPQLQNPLFVAHPHWGKDYAPVTESQHAMAERLVAAGVDLILGHGSHSMQAIEMIAGRPVVFGMGNFVWNTPGRFDKTGAPPFGLAAALDWSREALSLKLYPVLTDNRQTRFRNRPVTASEFETVAEILAPGLGGRPTRFGEKRAYHLALHRENGTWRVER